jgi:Fe-S cluster biosynthesis and repair protein YggX
MAEVLWTFKKKISADFQYPGELNVFSTTYQKKRLSNGKKKQTMLINENKLNMMETSSHQMLETIMTAYSKAISLNHRVTCRLRILKSKFCCYKVTKNSKNLLTS